MQQGAPTQAVADFLKSGRFPHAILIEGAQPQQVDDAIGQIAAALLCRAQDDSPCGQCLGCKKAAAGIHPDLLSYTGEGKSRAISVEKVREIRAQAHVAPIEGERKILLLRDAHTMLLPAQNALLKILEEPPPSAFFILSAENRFRLLETVRSRVSIISLENTGHAEPGKHGEIVSRIVEHLSLGEEAQVLACLSGWKDRGDFLQMLSELRACLLRHMTGGGYKGGGVPISPLQLWDFAAIIEKIQNSAEHNVGIPLLSCALCAGLFEEN